jgi:TPR repeat protein
VRLYRLAAEQGHALAQFSLGNPTNTFMIRTTYLKAK